MADTKKPIDTLRTKDAAELALTDYLIGHDDGSPAAFRTSLESLAEALAPELILPIIGQIETNSDGSFIRLENGLQVCWKNHSVPASVAVNVANSGWGYRSGQQDAPFPAAFIDSVRTFAVANINTVGYFATSGASSAASFTFHFVSGASVTVPSGAFVNLLAIGRWK